MTKEIDLLSLTKSGSTTKSSVTNNPEKKEGLSLFDSLLVDSKKELGKSDEEVIDKKSINNKSANTDETITSESKTKVISNEEKSAGENVEENKDTAKSKNLTDKETKPSENKESTPENKKSITVNQAEKNTNETNKNSSSSLLDRMVLEGKRKIDPKTTVSKETTEVNTGKVGVDETLVEEKKSKEPTTNIENKSNINQDTKKETTNNTENKNLPKQTGKNSEDAKEIDVQKETTNKDEVTSKQNGKVEVDSSENTEETVEKNIKQNDIDLEQESDKSDKSMANKQTQGTMNFDENAAEEKPQTELNIQNKNLEKEVKEATKKDSKASDKKPNITKEEVVSTKTQTSKVEKPATVDTKIVETDKVEIQTTDKKDGVVTKVQGQEKSIETNSNDKQINKEKPLVQESIKDEPIVDKKSETENKSSSVSKNDTNINNNVNSKNNFSDLDEKAIEKEEVRVDLPKKEVEKEETPSTSKEGPQAPKNTKSLMDRLLDNAKEQTISVKNQTSTQQAKTGNDLATNIFLSSQKNSIYTQMLMNKSEGVKTVKNAASIEDVKKGAEILDLELEDTSVEVEKTTPNQPKVEQNKQPHENKNNILDKLAFDKKMNKEEAIEKVVEKSSSQTTSTTSTSTTTTTSSNTEVTTVNLNVNQNMALSIENRIIAARQHMSAMMSDVARTMYENYKPPVTAFRLNLFPAQLGHIAILMKNDKDNAISISMNMSQSKTHDSFVENQTALKDALNKTFNSQTVINLDFGMQGDSSNSSTSSQEENSSNNNFQQTHSSGDILESISENQDVGEDLNYM